MKKPNLYILVAYVVPFVIAMSVQNITVPYIVTCAMVIILITSLIFRKKLFFKSWALSKNNFLLSKKEITFQSDIPPELLFDKLIEVIKKSKFKLADSDPKTFQLLAITPPNLLTWGENIYMDLYEDETKLSIVKFTSVTVFGFGWNRNKRNFDTFSQLFEESLTI